MHISLICSHSFPVPFTTYTGDYFIKNLASCFDKMGHKVTFVAPAGSYVPPHGQLLEMPCSWGKYPPTSQECEQAVFAKYSDELKRSDIIHDFSNSKQITESLNKIGFINTVSSPMGGNWNFATSLTRNIVVHSKAMLQRGLKGETDYTGTQLEHMGGPLQNPIKNAHVVHLGISTDFYHPTYNKKDHFLFLGRWHVVRGYKQVIELAKKTKIKLIIAGLDPNLEIFEAQKQCAYEAIELAKGASNISFEFLPEIGHHEKKRELMQQAKAVILPTQFHEPFGLTMVESLACGTPVITTNYGSMPEIVTQDAGFTCENNIIAFIDGIENIDKINPYLCRERAIKHFDKYLMARNFIKEYLSVINGASW